MKFLIGALAVVAAVLGWGWWHAHTHAALTLRVDDYALKTDKVLYASPHNVAIKLLGPANEPLALARSVEPLGYILALHPNSEIGNCEHRARGDHVECYYEYSAWAAQWAPRARRADVVVGSCEMRGLPVTVGYNNTDWLLWWLPLPHVGGKPYRYIELVMKIDSKACAGAGG